MPTHATQSLAALAAVLLVVGPATAQPQHQVRGNREPVQMKQIEQNLWNADGAGNLRGRRLDNGFGEQGAAPGPVVHPPYEGPITARKVQRGIDDALLYLRSRQVPDGSIGEGSYAAGGPTALASLALLAAGAHPTADEAMGHALDWLAKLEADNTYVVAIRANVWEYALRKVPEEPRYRALLKADFDWLLEARNAEGWRYGHNSSDWDNSCTQYGVLGIWAGVRAGLDPGKDFWKGMSQHFRRHQNEDGGWGYVQGSGSSANMATAGLASMFLVFDSHHGRTRYRRDKPRAFREGPAGEALASIERGMTWLGKTEGDRLNAYYLYGIERAGVASGRRRIGGVDWFHEGAEGALAVQQADGSFTLGYTAEISTALTSLFLVYGGAPVAMQKLEWGEEGKWNQNPRDLANLTRWLWSAYERPVNWQSVHVDAALEEFDAPILFLSGTEAPRFTDAQVETLRRYVLGGGTLLAEPSDGSPAFRDAMQTLATRLFPARGALAPLPADHPVFSIVAHPWRDRPALSGASDGSRTWFFLSEGYLAGDWQVNDVESDAFPLAMNLLFYASDLGALKGRFASALPEGPAAPAHPNAITVARARLGDGAIDAAAAGWQTAAAFARHVTGVGITDRGAVALTDEKLKGVDLLHITGRGGVKVSEAERAALRTFVGRGGTLLVDAWAGDAAFGADARALVAEIAGPLTPLGADDPLAIGQFEGGADLSEVSLNLAARRRLPGRVTGQQLEVARAGDRIAAVYSAFDLGAAMGDVAVYRAAGYRPADARRIVANVLGYLAERKG